MRIFLRGNSLGLVHSAYAICDALAVLLMHTTKKRKITIKENSHYSDLFFEASVLTPPRQH
jgi:hypothetical protein